MTPNLTFRDSNPIPALGSLDGIQLQLIVHLWPTQAFPQVVQFFSFNLSILNPMAATTPIRVRRILPQMSSKW